MDQTTAYYANHAMTYKRHTAQRSRVCELNNIAWFTISDLAVVSLLGQYRLGHTRNPHRSHHVLTTSPMLREHHPTPSYTLLIHCRAVSRSLLAPTPLTLDIQLAPFREHRTNNSRRDRKRIH